MTKTTDFERERLRREVAEEFPDDEMIQELHLIRLLMREETRDMEPAEVVRRFEQEQGIIV